MKKFWLFGLALFLQTNLLLAQQGNTLCVQTQQLNVRESPNGEIIGTLDRGEEVNAYASSYPGWALIEYRGMMGYASARYLGDCSLEPARGDYVPAREGNVRVSPYPPAAPQQQPAREASIYICLGKYAYAYHRHSNCRGLNNCRAGVNKVSLQDAQILGRRACQICY